ncbi:MULTISPECIES: exodeoxyribonuclease I [unclassified Shewanella]|uniref:exodeoxyribonuclease I n=1 Tax=unclassified Shewanella TaxID=196818 RepID=UPI000C84E83C|nr:MULTISPECIES: exodeoxyribonuclease I [unclassified Shewanella]MDO6640427.1 exodeoxyribonuclease I [Shewanella sp. 5_MG-2023]MDO6677889.1 exodeoxyribonuclease I [Shewanella sp. 4_MG-2023]PMG46533.1 exodeoxyribonuclease I [Shewanella sp. 10N.286.52.B9]PMI01997.1 exodeoxyribonuclease I [Shewanella sp. 10N.286.48.A6]
MASALQPTLFWHDYETFGVSPAKDRPSQFAGIRTDYDLNIIGEPENFYCKQATDYLPKPEAILVTGITPQLANLKGMVESEFMGRINTIFSQPNTCVVGYNSLRFDDEVSRYGFYRNFIDPYAREWQNGNTRWDIIDLVRACYAFRPEGINWPLKEDGSPSFKLEQLTQANGLSHEQAHDAMSDVYATIAIAKLIKEKQPKLYDYYFNLRNKNKVAELIQGDFMQPLVHVSSKISAAKGCVTLIAPVAPHPSNKNAMICINLAMDISPLIDLSVEDIVERMYTSRADLAPDELPIPLKQIHVNKCPFIGTPKLLTEEVAARHQFDMDFARQQYKLFKQHPELREKMQAVFEANNHPAATDPDLMLYSGGFFSRADKAKMEMIRNTKAENLAALNLEFDDPRIEQMLFRYRGRNYPETLSHDESLRWREFCQQRLSDADYVINLENLLEETSDNEHKQKLLKALCMYLQAL